MAVLKCTCCDEPLTAVTVTARVSETHYMTGHAEGQLELYESDGDVCYDQDPDEALDRDSINWEHDDSDDYEVSNCEVQCPNCGRTADYVEALVEIEEDPEDVKVELERQLVDLERQQAQIKAQLLEQMMKRAA